MKYGNLRRKVKFYNKYYLEAIFNLYKDEITKSNSKNTKCNDENRFNRGDTIYYIRHPENPFKCKRHKVGSFTIATRGDVYKALYGISKGWAYIDYADAKLAIMPKTSKMLELIYNFINDCVQEKCNLKRIITERDKTIERLRTESKQLYLEKAGCLCNYKGFFTHINYSAADKVIHGKIEGIKDLVTFESESATEIENEFHKAVDDYIAFCREVGKNVEEEKQ